jgi:hypothetical protein
MQAPTRTSSTGQKPETEQKLQPACEDTEEKAVNKRTMGERWQRARDFLIDDHTAAEPFSQALMQEMGWDDEFTRLAILEYKKFMVLSSLFPNENMTPSLHIDTVWHMHLMYTRSYKRFCREALDCNFVHHEPSTGGEAEAAMHKGSYSGTLDRYIDVFDMEPPQSFWGARVRTDVKAGQSSKL